MNDNPIMLASAIGFQFVRQYYTVLNKDPSKLHCFYKKPSHFTHGEEGARSDPVSGQHDINSQIIAMEFTNPKVVVSQLDAQPSSGGGVVVMVVGEMSNKEGPSRRFCQTFFLAAEETERYYVLNDIFRYLKESEPTLAPVPTPAPAAQPEPTPEPEQVSAPESVPEPTPEPEQAPVEEEKVQEEVPSAPEPVVEETQAPKETQQVEPTPAASEQTPAPSQPAPPKAWGNPRSNQPQGNPSPSNKPAPSETHETRKEKPDVSAFLANVTPDMESEIRAHFGQFGDIARVSFLKGSTAAFIDFKTVEQAEAAISAAAYTTSKGKQIKAEKRAHPKSQGHSNENGQRRDNYRDYRDYRDRDYQGGYSRRDQGYQNGSRRDDRDQRERRPQNGSSSSQSSSSRPYNPQPTSNRKPASAPAKN